MRLICFYMEDESPPEVQGGLVLCVSFVFTWKTESPLKYKKNSMSCKETVALLQVSVRRPVLISV